MIFQVLGHGYGGDWMMYRWCFVEDVELRWQVMHSVIGQGKPRQVQPSIDKCSALSVKQIVQILLRSRHRKRRLTTPLLEHVQIGHLDSSKLHDASRMFHCDEQL